MRNDETTTNACGTLSTLDIGEYTHFRKLLLHCDGDDRGIQTAVAVLRGECMYTGFSMKPPGSRHQA